MENNKFEEKILKEVANKYLKKARAGDFEHALSAVKWVKELGIGRSDLYLLITAAYIHDIGWSGIAPKGKIDLNELLKLEPTANMNSSKLIRKVLGELNFTDIEIKKVIRLVKAADKHESNYDDEEIIVDADNLSKLSYEHLANKYQQASYQKVINLWKSELSNRIKTAKGKRIYPNLLYHLEEQLNGQNISNRRIC